MKAKTNSYQIIETKVVNFRTADTEGNLKIEYGTKRGFVPQYYHGGETLYIVMSDYVEINGQPMPLTMDYYSPNGNFRLHSSFSGTQINPNQLVKGRNFEVRDVPHMEVVSRHDDLASMTVELMSLIELHRNRDHAGIRNYV